jgi:hypothetical protein
MRLNVQTNEEITLEQVERVWPDILRDVRVYDRTLQALLNSGVRPISVQGSVITLEVANDWLIGRLERPQIRLIIEKVATEHLGKKATFSCVVESQSSSSPNILRQQIREARKLPIRILTSEEERELDEVFGKKEQPVAPIKKEDPPAEPKLADVMRELASTRELLTKVTDQLAKGEEQEDLTPLNMSSITNTEIYEHDGLKFRSRSEVSIYSELKKRNVLFFPNALAVLGGQNTMRREPDFLVCQNGKWGILEVMGKFVHTPTTAVKDHDRGRLFNDYGVSCIHFYPAERCFKNPADVVDDFLKRLSRI